MAGVGSSRSGLGCESMNFCLQILRSSTWPRSTEVLCIYWIPPPLYERVTGSFSRVGDGGQGGTHVVHLVLRLQRSPVGAFRESNTNYYEHSIRHETHQLDQRSLPVRCYFYYCFF